MTIDAVVLHGYLGKLQIVQDGFFFKVIIYISFLFCIYFVLVVTLVRVC